MVLITNHNQYIKIDLTAFLLLDSVKYKHIYLMKDKAFSVKLWKDLKCVEVHTSDDIYELDMDGVKGLPAKIGNTIPLNNIQLAEELAKLRNL
jgi:hypothetical protein